MLREGELDNKEQGGGEGSLLWEENWTTKNRVEGNGVCCWRENWTTKNRVEEK